MTDFIADLEMRALRKQIKSLEAQVAEEMRYKSEAYAFILESGLFDQFREYRRLKVCGDNPHQACLDWLEYAANKIAQNRGKS